MSIRALQMHQGDDVAMVLAPCTQNEHVVVVNKQGAEVAAIEARADIPEYHKLALTALDAGALVHKYGQVIGRATAAIKPGDYVHVHNIESYKVLGGE